MRQSILTITAALCLLLSSCTPAPNQAEPPAPIGTATSILTPTAIASSAPTAMPLLPVQKGTTVPNPAAQISASNVQDLVELGRWGSALGITTDANLSPDGKKIAIASSLGVYLFAAENASRPDHILPGTRVDHVVFSPDGVTLAVVSADAPGNVQFLDSSDGSVTGTLESSGGEVSSLAYSPDGAFLGVVYGPPGGTHSDHVIRLWRVSDATVLGSLPVGTRELVQLLFSADGKVLYARFNSLPGEVVAYDLQHFGINREFVLPRVDFGTLILDAALATDGRVLAALTQSGCVAGVPCVIGVTAWEVDTGTVLGRTTIREGAYEDGDFASIAISPDGQTIAVAGFGKSQIRKLAQPDTLVRTSDSASGAPLAPPGYPHFLAFSADGRTLYGFDGGALVAWDAETLQVLKSTLLESTGGSIAPIGKAALSPNGDMLVTIGGEIDDWYEFEIFSGRSKPQVWSTHDGSEIPDFLGELPFADGVGYSPNGKWLATARDDSLILFPMIPSAGAKTIAPTHVIMPGQIAFSPDSKYVFLAGRSPYARVYSVEEGNEVTRIKGKELNKGDFTTLEFSRDGRYVVWGSGSLKVLETTGWKVTGELYGMAAALSEDGEVLAYVQRDGTIVLLDFPSLAPKKNILAHLAYPTLLAFGTDGTILVSAGKDGMLRFWSAADGSLLREIRAHVGMITFISFLPGGRGLLTASQDGTVRMWGIASQPLP